jgi:hypothetical protein
MAPKLSEILSAQSKPKSTGLVIRAEDERARMAADIKITLDGLAPKIQPLASQPRELGAMENGERIPMEYPSPKATEEERKWFSSLHAFASDMGVVIDPSNEHAWIAVKQNKHDSKPLLLLKLPLLNCPRPSQPF